jgi:hypothetical protein
MAYTSVVVQGHTLPSQTFFKPVIAQIQFSYSLLEVSVFFLEINDLICAGFPNRITRQSSFTGLQEILAPAVVEITVDAFPTT